MTDIIIDGMTFSVSAAAPATQDQAGYDALTYTAATDCEIIDFSGWDDSWGSAADDTLCINGKPPRKTKKIFGPMTLSLQFEKISTIHALLKTGFDSQSDQLACKVLFPDGVDMIYFMAEVTKYNPVFGGTGSKITTPTTLQPTVERVEVFASWI